MIAGFLALAAAAAGELALSFEGLAPRGEVKVAVFADEGGWRARSEPVRSAMLPVAGSKVEVRFSDLPPGSYGVMAYHDRNANGRLDTLPIGLPTEPYGFSNNARGSFGPPSWRSATVAVGAGETKAQAIRLR